MDATSMRQHDSLTGCLKLPESWFSEYTQPAIGLAPYKSHVRLFPVNLFDSCGIRRNSERWIHNSSAWIGSRRSRVTGTKRTGISTSTRWLYVLIH
jgi:hypothetical protein